MRRHAQIEVVRFLARLVDPIARTWVVDPNVIAKRRMVHDIASFLATIVRRCSPADLATLAFRPLDASFGEFRCGLKVRLMMAARRQTKLVAPAHGSSLSMLQASVVWPVGVGRR
jgi:hypothetical protein